LKGYSDPGAAGSRTSLDETIAARVQAIVAAAEREAEAARHDIAEHRRTAEQEARDYVAASRVHADEEATGRARVLEQLAGEARREADDLRDRISALGTTVEELARTLRGGGGAARRPEPPWEEERRPPLVAAPELEERQGRERSDALPPELRSGKAAPARSHEPRTDAAPDAARLAAIEMAVGGASRGEVERHLSREFGLESSDLLDAVFGPERDATTRLSWGRP
jgi:hypothetical protein